MFILFNISFSCTQYDMSSFMNHLSLWQL
ncbi:unnamed protein product [Spirodela intermedia]|uniref:Uncharacterized protein n=1 Tax=Spirodela intermedia TaxID=51605 RepID=A0ABN7EAK1_SPIIN|nr:unnamed protein product [Spirodela intermedia]